MIGMFEKRPLVILDLQGKLVKEFDSIAKCCRELNIHDGAIHKVLIGQSLTVCKKQYMVKYKEEYNPLTQLSYKAQLNRRKLMKGNVKTIKKTYANNL
jgi:hypothetical protein